MTRDIYPKFQLPSGNWTTDEEYAKRLWARQDASTLPVSVPDPKAPTALCRRQGHSFPPLRPGIPQAVACASMCGVWRGKSGLLHYPRPHICGSTVNLSDQPCPECGAEGAL